MMQAPQVPNMLPQSDSLFVSPEPQATPANVQVPGMAMGTSRSPLGAAQINMTKRKASSGPEAKAPAKKRAPAKTGGTTPHVIKVAPPPMRLQVPTIEKSRQDSIVKALELAHQSDSLGQNQPTLVDRVTKLEAKTKNIGKDGVEQSVAKEQSQRIEKLENRVEKDSEQMKEASASNRMACQESRMNTIRDVKNMLKDAETMGEKKWTDERKKYETAHDSVKKQLGDMETKLAVIDTQGSKATMTIAYCKEAMNNMGENFQNLNEEHKKSGAKHEKLKKDLAAEKTRIDNIEKLLLRVVKQTIGDQK